MGDEEGMCGKPSKFFISDKPLLEGTTDLQSVDWKELDLNAEVPQFQPFETIFPQEESESVWDWTSEPFTLNFTIDAKSARGLRKLVRCPKLPRKLKKYVKKHYFDEYPKRVSPFMLRLAFAFNNPHKAGKVGLQIGVDIAKEDEQERH